MPYKDMPLAQLQSYTPALTRQPDFDAYWEAALAESSRVPLDVEITPLDYPAHGVTVSRITFRGAVPGRITGWLLVPDGQTGRCPAMVFYHGYSGWKGDPYDYLPWAAQGYVVLAVDVRGQSGDSTDEGQYPGGHVTGWMTLGITDPQRCYYRGVFLDVARAIDVVTTHNAVDAARIGVAGISQGGGLALAAAALQPARVSLAMPSVPFLCHYERASEMAERPPYTELATYCLRYPGRIAQVWRTLSYVDTMNLAPRITAAVLMTVGLRDDVCPASTVYAVFNHLAQAREKEMFVSHYGSHEVFPGEWEQKLRWASRILRPHGT